MSHNDQHRVIDLSLWKDKFKYLRPDFINSIRYMVCCGYYDFLPLEYSNHGYVMSSDDRSYVYGESICNWIGLEHDENEARDITQLLNGRQIKHVDYGEDFVAILTRDGCVYLASEPNSKWKTYNTLEQINGPSDRYEKIACGRSHMLLIRTDKRLMARGRNGNGQITGQFDNDSYWEMRDTGLSDVVHISCGYSHSMAMTSDGKLYVWGSNGNGQLGLNDKDNRNSPTLVQIDGRINDFVGGSSHSLILMQDGTLYGCGSNSWGKLGLKNEGGDVSSPTRLLISNVVCIASNWSYQFNLAFTQDNTCYVCGLLSNQYQFRIFTQTKSVVDNYSSAFSLYSCEPNTFGWNQTTNHKSNLNCKMKLQKSIQDRFDNGDDHDIVFTFPDCDKKIFAHRHYLSHVSKYMERLLSSEWCTSNTVQITTYSYHIFYDYLKMLHFGQISITDDNLPEFLDLAKCYGDDCLLELCIEHMTKHLKKHNLSTYVKLSIKYELEDFLTKQIRVSL